MPSGAGLGFLRQPRRGGRQPGGGGLVQGADGRGRLGDKVFEWGRGGALGFVR
jgi:hypothetical protein